MEELFQNLSEEEPLWDLGEYVGSVKETLEEKLGLTPEYIEYAGNVGGIISGVAAVAGYFKDREENRKIIGELKKIKEYLQRIESKVNSIIEQNNAILEKIDQLPAQIQAIVREEVANAFLSERYSRLEAIKLNYYNLPEEERERYRIHTQGWDTYSQALTYLFSHENRLSQLIYLLNWCEFALVITEYQSASMIDSLINNKKSLIIGLLLEVRQNLEAAHNNFLLALNSKYIKSHNFSEELNNLDDLQYELADPQLETIVDIVMVCPDPAPGTVVDPADCFEDLRETINPFAVMFNKERYEFPEKIEDLKIDLLEKLEFYVNVRDAAVMCEIYRGILKEDMLIFNMLSSLVSINNNQLQKKSVSNFFIGISDTRL